MRGSKLVKWRLVVFRARIDLHSLGPRRCNRSVDRRRGEVTPDERREAYCNRWNLVGRKHVAQRSKPHSKGVADRMPCRAATSEKLHLKNRDRGKTRHQKDSGRASHTGTTRTGRTGRDADMADDCARRDVPL